MPPIKIQIQQQHPDSVEDLNYVVHKIHELINIFNEINIPKGCSIKNISFNSENNEISCALNHLVTMH